MNYETLGAQNDVQEIPALVELSELQLALVGGGIGETILVK
jgi:hypothetical protein